MFARQFFWAYDRVMPIVILYWANVSIISANIYFVTEVVMYELIYVSQQPTRPSPKSTLVGQVL